MRQDDMVKNRKKLAWGARGRRFESSHPDSFALIGYETNSTCTILLKTDCVAGMWQVMHK